ncbi:DNA primase [Glycomyces buryatensis]|uniref:DNA primase n=1 Tax=Glycomyces buryatensis TaxID=2570927 RepID=A0A4S8QF87_9ACTN|nr:DNA primase [Glycomyces buryatensis]THV43327.1 DNA primase [Glycomyces buryatensis]
MAAESGGSARTAESDKLWNETNVDPVELHLGKDSGYTLRAYRMSDTLPREDVVVEPTKSKDDVEDGPDVGDNPEDEDENEVPDEIDFLDELDAAPEEVPVFLTRKGKLLVFRDPESLAEYVAESDDNDLAVIEEYGELQKRITAEAIVCDEADTYEMDLVVANLRGGHDAWEPELLIKAAEVGRDLGFALRNQSIVEALTSGSPLDDIDESLRLIVDGGFRGAFARRRLRKTGSEQAAIAWRAVIAKINRSVEWRGTARAESTEETSGDSAE